MNQASGTRQVLVCENPNRPGMGIAAALQNYSISHHFKVVKASSKESALNLLQTQPIAIAVIDVGRESGETLSLLRSIGRGFPILPLFLFNGFMIPGIAEKAKEYDHVRYCEDPADLPGFISQILEDVTTKKRGMIRGILLTNFLDWLDTIKLSGQVAVSSGARKGVLFLKDGRLVGAEMGGPSSATALAEMSSWEKVTVEIKEGSLPGHAARGPVAAPRPPDKKKAGRHPEHGDSNIETLRLVRRSKTLTIHIKALQLAVAAMREQLPDTLRRIDVFLSAGGRSLAGWNSQPLASSAFAGVTRSLFGLLDASRFPPLGNYYLFDLADETLALVVVCGELQMGLQLVKSRLHMGLLTNIVLPQALKALNESVTIESPK